MIGVFGGTFDPVHYGHLVPAQDVMMELGLEKILFIPNKVPPHRDRPSLTVAQRIELLQLALVDYAGFEIDLREVGRDGPSYMIDTLLSLEHDYPDSGLCLIMGMDAFTSLTDWHRWQELLEHCHVVVTARPGYVLPDTLDPWLQGRLAETPDELCAERAGKILVKSVSLLDISASDIRQQIMNGERVSDMMPQATYEKYLELMTLHAD